MQISRFEVKNVMKNPFLVLKDNSCSLGSGLVRNFAVWYLMKIFYSENSLLTDTGKRINSLPKTWQLRIWGALWRWGPMKTSFETFLYLQPYMTNNVQFNWKVQTFSEFYSEFSCLKAELADSRRVTIAVDKLAVVAAVNAPRTASSYFTPTFCRV